MTTITMRQINNDKYNANHGQRAEYIFRYTWTGLLCKADNLPASLCADCDGIQIKSARATICKGTDIRAHVEADPAEWYAYVVNDFTIAYIMSKAEYIEFATRFATVTTESPDNGGAIKTRLKIEGRKMTAWLKSHA